MKSKPYYIDETGRVTIPTSIREVMHLPAKTPLKVYLEGGRIIIEKAELSCRMCGSAENMIEVICGIFLLSDQIMSYGYGQCFAAVL